MSRRPVPCSRLLLVFAILLACLGTRAVAARPVSLPACTGVSWGYSIGEAIALLATIPTGSELGDKDVLHRASVHIEQVINHFALITDPQPVCWPCNPFAGTATTGSALFAANLLDDLSDGVYVGLPPGQYAGLKDTIIGWENAPPSVEWGPDVGSEIIDDEYTRKPARDAS